MTTYTNLPEFKAQMDALKDDLSNKTLRAATNAAAQVYGKAVRLSIAAKTTERTGVLSRSVFVARTRRGVGRGVARYYVSIRGGKIARTVKRGRMAGLRLDAFYWKWVEAGHTKRQASGPIRGGRRSKALQRSRLRASGGYVPGRWFVRDAFPGATARALDVFYRRMGEGIAKYR